MQAFNDIIVRARNNGNNMSRAAASSVTPKDDQLCADMINRIIKASDNNRQSKAAATGINNNKNKALMIHDFIASNGKRF